jgi:hypothetical protein
MFAEWAESGFARFSSMARSQKACQKRGSESGWQKRGYMVEMPRLG